MGVSRPGICITQILSCFEIKKQVEMMSTHKEKVKEQCRCRFLEHESLLGPQSSLRILEKLDNRLRKPMKQVLLRMWSMNGTQLSKTLPLSFPRHPGNFHALENQLLNVSEMQTFIPFLLPLSFVQAFCFHCGIIKTQLANWLL